MEESGQSERRVGEAERETGREAEKEGETEAV